MPQLETWTGSGADTPAQAETAAHETPPALSATALVPFPQMAPSPAAAVVAQIAQVPQIALAP